MNATTGKTKELFEAWRRGDAEAGQAMAQRFTDWFFAISATHSGEQQGRQSFQAACDRFSKGVAAVPDPKRLGPWAQNVARDLIHAGRPPLDDGDFQGSYTGESPPKALLLAAREAQPEEVNQLLAAYRNGDTSEPMAVLKARYAVKRWLAHHHQVPFRQLPREIDPDLIPVPLYEAAQLKSPTEIANLELFLLDEPDLIQDVAEFAHFSIALRGGLDAGVAAAHKAAGHQHPKATVVPGSQRTHPGTTPGADPQPHTPPASQPPAPMTPPSGAPTGSGPDMNKLVPLLGGLVVLLLLAVIALAYVALG